MARALPKRQLHFLCISAVGPPTTPPMFACVRGDADEASLLGSTTARERLDVADDDDVINRVLEEGLRLKKKCKQLSALLQEREADLERERDAREAAGLHLHDKVQFELAKADAAHAEELARHRHAAEAECAALCRELEAAHGALRALQVRASWVCSGCVSSGAESDDESPFCCLSLSAPPPLRHSDSLPLIHSFTHSLRLSPSLPACTGARGGGASRLGGGAAGVGDGARRDGGRLPGQSCPGLAWPGLAWPGLAWPDLCSLLGLA